MNSVDKGIRVVSLFDGMSCGQIALQKLGVKIDRYDAFEIDKHAIKVSSENFPDMIHHGSVEGADFKQFEGADLLLAGSPCQGFSVAGKQLNFDDPRSKLFFEFVRALKEIRPRYFLLENVCMKKEWRDVITDHVGIGPILINSALVSAQNRKRLYWTNIPGVTQPEDRGILLEDILEMGGGACD
jgi:site-specific DNA-cytosine methylase